MKKIGIITIIDYMNYGNRLQNYATQEVLKSLGFIVETIVNYPQDNNITESIFKKIKRANLKTYISFAAKVFKKVRLKFHMTKRETVVQELNQFKNISFIEFTKNNIKETDYIITPNAVPSDLGDEYDYFVVGSDQVWNPNFRNGSPLDFLTFASTEKRVAYSASFGVSEIQNIYVDRYKKWLKEMSHISVREQSGARLIKHLTGRDVQVLLDPTMMLTKKDWMMICKPVDEKNENYLLTYFLGKVSDEKSNWLNIIAEKYGLAVINLANVNDIRHYDANPAQFIYFMNNCNMFCTDSFHGVVFSILFEKSFVVFDRDSKIPSMSSRIDTILSKFKLEERKWDNIRENDDVMSIDYSHVPEILQKERAKTYDYLKTALKIEDENFSHES